MALMSVTSRTAAAQSLFGTESNQVVYEVGGNYVSPKVENRAPNLWYLGLFRSKSDKDQTPVVAEGLGRVVIPNTDDYWDTTPGYAVTKKRLVFPGTLSGLPDADSKAYILMAGLYTSDSSTGSMWMTGQLARGAILIKNGQGFAIETKGVLFVADVSVA